MRLCKQRGVNVGGSGERAVRLRPMLIFEPYHGKVSEQTPSLLLVQDIAWPERKLTAGAVDILLETLELVLKT